MANFLHGLRSFLYFYRYPLIAFAVTQLLFLLAILLGNFSPIPLNTTEPARVTVNSFFGLDNYWRWDAIHYYSVAVDGYARFVNAQHYSGLMAFFPVLPALLRIGCELFGGLANPDYNPIRAAAPSMLVSGIVISAISQLSAFIMFYRLAYNSLADKRQARYALFYLAFFPLGFYYLVPYTEALFLLASLGFFMEVQQRHWLRAALWSALATGTRPVGILLVAILVVEVGLALYRNQLKGWQDWKRITVAFILAPLGLVAFMLYLTKTTGHPLAFITVHYSEWGHERSFPLITLIKGISYGLQPVSTTIYLAGTIHLILTLFFLTITALSARVWPLRYTIYCGLSLAFVLAAPLPGERAMSGMGRYLMVLFPVYLTLAGWKLPVIGHRILLGVSLIVFLVCSRLYISWYLP